jgi:hypothetical protein
MGLDGSIALKATLCKFGVKLWIRFIGSGWSKDEVYGYSGKFSVLHMQGIP